MNYDFIIYGGGMSSQIAALALAKDNFKVCLIENSTIKKSDTNLVTFLSQGSVNYLHSIIDDAAVFKEFLDIKKITCNMANTNKNSSITFDSEPNSVMGKILPNKIIKEKLDLNIKKNKNVHTLVKSKSIQKKTSSNKVSIAIDGQEEIFASVFILSANDQTLLDHEKIKFIYHDLDQTALSMNVTGEFKKQNHAFQIFTTSGPLAFLPYSDDKASIVWSLKNNSKELQYEKIYLESKVNSYFEKEIGTLKIENIETHKLKFNFAKKLYEKNTVIIGNIAHNIHPIAGQGLNLSIKDISLFLEIITKYTSIGYELHNQMAFREFDQLRKVDNATYSFGTLALDKFLASKNNLARLIANTGFKILKKNKFVKQKIVNNATGMEHFKSL